MWKSLNYTLEKMPREVLILLICVLVAVIGIVDYTTSFDILISLLYLIPVLLAVWYLDLVTGIILSFTCAIIWLVTSYITTPAGNTPTWVLIVNAAILLTAYLVIARLLANLHRTLSRERRLARTDYLTGILNTRAFHDQANIEIARAKRSQKPFTIAYFDLVNFKTVLDHFGPTEGDKVLHFIGRELSRYLRVTDVIGRMGGEEFIILFSETDQQNAYSVIARLYGLLTEEIRKRKWPVKINMGVLTCNDTNTRLDVVLKEIDGMLFEAKKSGKSQITYRVLEQR
jgi:diguanylate cyclase (GGDEF)-like protein